MAVCVLFEPDDAALDLVTTVLSDGKNSRLYKRLVYDEQVASERRGLQLFARDRRHARCRGHRQTRGSFERLKALIDEEIDRFARARAPTSPNWKESKPNKNLTFSPGSSGSVGSAGKPIGWRCTTRTWLTGFLEGRLRKVSAPDAGRSRIAAERYLLRPRLEVSFVQEEPVKSDAPEPDRSVKPA